MSNKKQCVQIQKLSTLSLFDNDSEYTLRKRKSRNSKLTTTFSIISFVRRSFDG